LVVNNAALVFVDYGGFYDSAGGKVTAWAGTFMTAPQEQYSIVIFFEGSKDIGGNSSTLTEIQAEETFLLLSNSSQQSSTSFSLVTQATAFEAMECCGF
jgi:hypothetical protein